MRILLRGLWARRRLNEAALLVTVVALVATVLGPLYASASVEHLIDSRITAQPVAASGLSLSLPAMPASATPTEDPDRYDPPDPLALVNEARRVVDGPQVDRFWSRGEGWLRDPGGQLTYRRRTFMVPLYWRQGMCDLAVVEGTCPGRANEVLVQETMARTLGLGPGDTLQLRYVDNYQALDERSQVVDVAQRTRRVVFDVVGTYRIPDPGSAGWYQPARVVGYERLDPPPPSGAAARALPPTPALLTSPVSMTSQTFEGGVDRLIDLAAVDLGTLDATERAVNRFVNRASVTQSHNIAEELELHSIFDSVREERTLLSRVMIAALAPLVVLALLLLYALVSAGAAARRPYVALAKLRGHSRLQVFWFAVGEPFLVIALATPIAVGLAVACAHVIARSWFIPGIPVEPGPGTWLALAAVVAGALAASAVAAVDVIREPLARALSAAVSRGPGSRVGLVLRSGAVAVALAAVGQLLTSGDQANQVVALLAPLSIALAVAVLGSVVLRLLSRWWQRRTALRGGASSFLASRRLARRPDLTNLMVPLLLAVSVIGFALNASVVSDDWRVSRARSDAGAARTFLTDTDPGRLMHLTRNIDPEGDFLLAAVVETGADGMGRRVFLDTTRLATVAAWDPSWSDETVNALQHQLMPRSEDRIRFTGGSVSVSVRDVMFADSELTPRTVRTEPQLVLQYVNDDGFQREVVLGPLRNRVDEVTLTQKVFDCQEQCVVDKLFISGEGRSSITVNGQVTITGVAVDDRRVDWGLTESGRWRAARPFPVSLVDAPVVPTAADNGLVLDVYLNELPEGRGAPSATVGGFASITPRSTPDVAPVVVTQGIDTEQARRSGGGTAIQYDPTIVEGTALNGQSVPMRIVARVRALPGVGSTGEMADLETSMVEFEPRSSDMLTYLWTAPGTPTKMLDAVRSGGVVLTPQDNLARIVQALRADAFSLGLRLFLIVGIATLLLAVFGVLAAAVLQTRWRAYEAASLRVLGVRGRSLVRASGLEYLLMLGLAVVFGVVSAYISVRLALPAVSLGPVDEFEPAPTYDAHPWILLGVGMAVLLVATVIALAVSVRTTRLGRPSTLRWAEQT